MVAQAEDAFEQALALHQESLAIRKELGDRLGFAITLANLAEITQVQQDYSRARDLYLESIAICRDIGDTLGIAQRLERLAQIATAEGLHERAVRLCSAALSTRDALGAAMSTEERAAHDSILTAARAALQEHTFAAASALGRAFTVDEAMAEARKLETQVINAATGPAQAPRQRPVSHSLSHLEQEIAARIAAGSTNRQIAADLGIALRTVDTHVGKVLEKLGCTSRAQIAERLLHDDH
jgi:non-specific serine/threonine protein kinase